MGANSKRIQGGRDPVKIPALTIAEWLDAEAQIYGEELKPEGYITVYEYAEMRGIRRPRASDILNQLHSQGLADKKIWKRDRHLLAVYRLKK